MAKESTAGPGSRTMAWIRRALVRLMSTHTPEQITVEEICRESGVSRSTFYSYFDSKYDALDWIVQDLTKTVSALDEALFARPSKDLLTGRAAAAVHVQLQAFADRRAEYAALLRGEGGRRNRRRMYSYIYRDVIRCCQERFVCSRPGDDAAAWACRCFASAMVNLYKQLIAQESLGPAQERQFLALTGSLMRFYLQEFAR